MPTIEGVLRSELRVGPTAEIFVNDTVNGPYFTMQSAIDACVDNRGDIILKARGGEEVTSTVNFNKAGIRVVSVGPTMAPLAQGEFHSIYADAAFVDGPVATFTADRCVVDGLGFVSRDTGATFWSGAAALIGGGADANPFGVHLVNCRFPKWGLDNRIGLAIEGSSDVLIEHCGFEGVGSNFETGIYVQGATANLTVEGCVFRDCTYGITHGAFAGGGPDALYKGNTFLAGKVLDAGGNAAIALLTDNYSQFATNATSYSDTVSALQTLGIEFSGNHYSE
ncbi:hypothetical protein LCGC14_1962310 [marine sediment metagenome]|uniref:Right handed beta helix domain-containing protein n=1 Tax=marine sediment metagenome TaxID=412755 RepID=A0A0F9FE51_9ZZZZ